MSHKKFHKNELNDDPVTLAIALESDDGRAKIAKLTAKGEGAFAEQIRALAVAQGVPVHQDADLAELLTAVDLESDIPLPALAAVAEILTFLYESERAPLPAGLGLAQP